MKQFEKLTLSQPSTVNLIKFWKQECAESWSNFEMLMMNACLNTEPEKWESLLRSNQKYNLEAIEILTFIVTMIQPVLFSRFLYYYPNGENIFSFLTFQLLLAPCHNVNFTLYLKYTKLYLAKWLNIRMWSRKLRPN